MAKRVKVNSQQFAQRWASGLQGASQKIEEGIQAVSEAPGKAAAAQVNVWLQNVTAAKEKWAANTGNVSLEDWKRAAIGKGIPNLQNSIAMSQTKVEASAAKIISAVNAGLANIPPRGTSLEANMQRSMHMAKAMKQAFRK